MEWLLIIFALLCALPIFLFVRLLCKRIRLLFRLKSVCRSQGYKLIPTHRFWFLGWTNGINADFHIVTSDTVYSVKLIGVISKRICYKFVDEKNYMVKNLMLQFSVAASGIQYKPKTKKPYDFDYGLPNEYSTKNRETVILMNPISLIVTASTFEERRKRLENGDRIKEGVFFSGDGFIRKLQGQFA